jgi:Tol biopolymer transport system component
MAPSSPSSARSAQGPEHQLLVANVDGTGAHVITKDPITFDLSINWSADGQAIVLDDGHGHLTWLDAVGSAEPRKVTYPGVRDLVALRPPTESQLLYRTVTAKGWLLQVMDLDGTDAHPLIAGAAPSLREDDYSGFSWSPDGTKVAFRMHPDKSGDLRLFIVNADGTGLHPLTHEVGTWCERDMFWSPDSTRIAMNRWQLDPTTGDWPVRKVALVDVEDGTIQEVGPTPQPDGAEFAFSPDGASLVWSSRAHDRRANLAQSSAPILLDLATDTSRTIGTAVDAGIDWQRLAP